MKKTSFATATILSIATLAFAHSAVAAPQYSPLTGSWYDYINLDLNNAHVEWTWEQAAFDASQRTFMGRTGHLVTITSSAEEEVLFTHWGGDIVAGEPWIGAYRIPGSDPVSGWQWITGEIFSYTNWLAATGEPNNTAGIEMYAHYLSTRADPGPIQSGWNDVPASYRTEYFIEYSVPLPGALALFGIGGLGMLAIGGTRRRRLAGPA